MSDLTQALVDVGFSARRAEAIEAAIVGALPDAADVAFTPAGNVAADNVQDAIEELDTEKVATPVGTGDISDGAVTNAKLADMAASTIKMRNNSGSGDPQDQTVNDLTEVTDNTGADFMLTWDTSASAMAKRSLQNTRKAGGLQLLSSGTVSNAATLDIVLTSFTAYRALKIILSSFVPATDDVELWMRFSTDGGSNYDAGAGNYRYALNGIHDNNAALSFNSTSDTKIGVGGHGTNTLSVSNTAAEGGLHSEIVLHDQSNTGVWTKARISTVYIAASGNVVEMNGGGARVTTQDTDAVRFLFEGGGNIASGNWALYGYA